MELIKALVIVSAVVAVAFYAHSIVQPDTNQRIVGFFYDDVFPKMPLYSFIKSDIVEGTLAGVAASVAFSSIPFMPNPPMEPYIIYSYTKGNNPALLVSVSSVIVTVASAVSYLVGYAFGPALIEKVTKKEFKYNSVMKFFSAPITFLTHLIPIPFIAGVFPFVFGAYRSNLKFFIVAAFLGIAIRFGAAIILFNMYGDEILNLPSLISSIF